jgi:hypothetical protein
MIEAKMEEVSMQSRDISKNVTKRNQHGKLHENMNQAWRPPAAQRRRPRRGRGALAGPSELTPTFGWWALGTILPCWAWHGRELGEVSRHLRSAGSAGLGKVMCGGLLKWIFVRYHRQQDFLLGRSDISFHGWI